VTVIGLGNPLMADDGLGVLASYRLTDEWELPPDVHVVDGGTWGMNLLPLIEDAERLLLIDAIDKGMPPGTQVMLARDEVPRALAQKLSPHQIDLREVIALAELRGTLPEYMVAVGLQPERVELDLDLSPSVERGVDALLVTAVQQLRIWGHACEPRYRGAHA
jgi:hydrogenase maturation protease